MFLCKYVDEAVAREEVNDTQFLILKLIVMVLDIPLKLQINELSS